jgi:hypothetical protein
MMRNYLYERENLCEELYVKIVEDRIKSTIKC